MANHNQRFREIQRPLNHTFRRRSTLPGGHGLEFVLDGRGMRVRWDDITPPPLAGELLQHYREAREVFLALVGRDLGVRVLTVELPHDAT